MKCHDHVVEKFPTHFIVVYCFIAPQIVLRQEHFSWKLNK